MRVGNGGSEAGVALVLTLFATAALSMLGASVLLVSRMETFASMNQRMTSHARYGAEAGVHQAANYLLHTYVPPGTVADPLSNYTMSVSPVTRAGAAVILSANAAMPSNYPVAATQAAFLAAAAGTLSTGTWTVRYTTHATLLSMRPSGALGAGAPASVQTWRITSEGSIAGPRPVLVQVSAILEREAAPAFPHAAFAASSACSALSFANGARTDSYDSSNIQRSGGSVVTQLSGGSVGTNGNLRLATWTTWLFGSLSTPMEGTGSCSSGSVTAATVSDFAQLVGGVVKAPAYTPPPPATPSPLPPQTTMALNSGSHCSGIPGCTRIGPSSVLLAPGSYGNLTIANNVTVHFRAGVYVVNSIDVANNGLGGTVEIDSPGPVIWRIAGVSKAIPVVLEGNLTNAGLNPATFQVEYAGTGEIQIKGDVEASGLIYAPAATVTMVDNGDWYGAVIANRVVNTEGLRIHYDRQLASSFLRLGQPMLGSFTWNKF